MNRGNVDAAQTSKTFEATYSLAFPAGRHAGPLMRRGGRAGERGNRLGWFARHRGKSATSLPAPGNANGTGGGQIYNFENQKVVAAMIPWV